MTKSLTIQEGIAAHNEERLKNALRVLVDEEIDSQLITIERFKTALDADQFGYIAGQIAESQNRIAVLNWFKRRLAARTGRYAVPSTEGPNDGHTVSRGRDTDQNGTT